MGLLSGTWKNLLLQLGSTENKASSQKNSKNFPPSPTLFNGGSSLKLLGENDESEKYKFHPLVLVEDVDILYAEDRGCIAVIQQIAETSKGPIILTSNRKMTS
ncbi:unnamed protein product [Sphenostylis stenocarpa]|uniref:ATPase AAA-type core domain-containing protein n=1 Tax=Sphenostylis stenocarpa TaxID=92480 RepID=A0AA86SKW8_9FABA|nr:unnamed protein product [Sphenostylis stenocarpa]